MKCEVAVSYRIIVEIPDAGPGRWAMPAEDAARKRIPSWAFSTRVEALHPYPCTNPHRYQEKYAR
jgi:hypothetical protein